MGAVVISNFKNLISSALQEKCLEIQNTYIHYEVVTFLPNSTKCAPIFIVIHTFYIANREQSHHLSKKSSESFALQMSCVPGLKQVAVSALNQRW